METIIDVLLSVASFLLSILSTALAHPVQAVVVIGLIMAAFVILPVVFSISIHIIGFVLAVALLIGGGIYAWKYFQGDVSIPDSEEDWEELLEDVEDSWSDT